MDHVSVVHRAVNARSAPRFLQPDEQSLLPWLAFNRLVDCGSVTQHKLLSFAGSMDGLCHAGQHQLEQWMTPIQAREWLAFCERRSGSRLLKLAREDYARANEAGAVILHIESLHYPVLLSEIHAAPVVLFVQGDVTALHLPQVAVVGSRHASAGGLELAGEFASSLGKQGMAITSGLALGIDGAAHRAAILVGASSIAVVATGLDEVYPRRHVALARQLIEAGGAIVSEMPPGTPPQACNFPRRNRIISGLSLGTLVIEAGLQSGSLITARYAMEQGREVFALPGSVRSLLHRGCHELIRNGATLVETTADIANQLGGMLAFKQEECRILKGQGSELEGWSEEAIRVLRCLDHTPVALDALAERAGMPVSMLSAALLDLELAGAIQHQHGLYTRS